MVAVAATGAASLRLDADDLAKVTISPTWGPFSESLLSLRLPWQRTPSPLVQAWQRAVSGQLDDWVAPLRLLARVKPPVDLHTIVGETPEMERALETLASAPTDQLHEELEPLRRSTAGSATWVRVWLRDLARGDRRAHEALANLLRRYYRCAIAPYWETIRSYLDAEQARRGGILIRRGVDGLLGTLHPRVQWRPPSVLDVGAGPGPRQATPTYVLGGRSLVLVPSVFCVDGPHVFRSNHDPASPYVLVYPALREMCDAASLWAPGIAPKATALAKLLGRTRAKALQTVAETRTATTTTTGLARQLRVSPATASHHLRVLRDARLITSRRSGTEVAHRVTPLGRALLTGGQANAEPLSNDVDDQRSDDHGSVPRLDGCASSCLGRSTRSPTSGPARTAC